MIGLARNLQRWIVFGGVILSPPIEAIAGTEPGTRNLGVYSCFRCGLTVPQVDYGTVLDLQRIRADFDARFGYDQRLVPGDSLTLCATFECATYELTLDGEGYVGRDRQAILPPRDPRDFWQEPGWSSLKFENGGGNAFGGLGTPVRGTVNVGLPTPTAKP